MTLILNLPIEPYNQVVRRRVFNILAALTLVRCVTGWIVNRYRSAQIAYWGRHTRVIVLLDRGHILCELTRGALDTSKDASWRRWYWSWESPGGFGELKDWVGQQEAWFYRFGFAAEWARPTSFGISPTQSVPAMTYTLSLPLWSLSLLIAIPSVVVYRRNRQRQIATLLGLCPICGYDLRATPEHCPECGTAAGTNTREAR